MDIQYERLNITLPLDVLKKFKKFCEDNGINVSSRIAVLIKKDLEQKNPLKK